MRIINTIAVLWISAVLCHSLDPTQTRGLVSMEAMLVIKDIYSTNRLVNSHTFGSNFIVLSLIWGFYVPTLIFCQKALHCRLRLWCLHVSLLRCSVNSQQRMKNVCHSSFLHTAALPSPWTRAKHVFISLLLLFGHFSKHKYLLPRYYLP